MRGRHPTTSERTNTTNGGTRRNTTPFCEEPSSWDGVIFYQHETSRMDQSQADLQAFNRVVTHDVSLPQSPTTHECPALRRFVATYALVRPHRQLAWIS